MLLMDRKVERWLESIGWREGSGIDKDANTVADIKVILVYFIKSRVDVLTIQIKV